MKKIIKFYHKLSVLTKTLIFLIFFFTIIFWIIPYFVPIKLNKIPESETFWDSNWILVGQKIVNNKYRHEYLSLTNTPKFAMDVVVGIEDKRFYRHFGVDMIWLGRAVWQNIKNKSIVQWWSTITSQLIRNNFWLNSDRSIGKKVSEFYLAVALEKKLKKSDILENYLNILDFGYMNFGLVSASRFYLAKEINELTNAEIIALLVLPRNPNKYNPYTNPIDFRKRFELITKTLKKNKYLTDEEYNQILSENIVWNTNHDDILPYITTSPLISRYDKRHYLTVDLLLTQKIQEIANESIQELQWKNVSDYGILIVDRKSLEIKTLIWWIDFQNSENGQYNSVFALNQPWSAVKPFTYLLSFAKLWFEPNTQIVDEPVQYQTQLGFAYNPRNFNLDYQWVATLSYSLANSLNIPAVKLAQEIWIQDLLNFYRIVWFTNLSKNWDQYWLALTLGVGEVSLYQLLRSYTIFGEWWYLCDFQIYKNTTKKCQKVISKKYTDMIVEILTDRYNKIANFPINSKLDFANNKVFWKSGTSRRFSDNWVVWFTDKYYIAVWVWNKDGSNMKWVSGASGAGDIFAKIIAEIENKIKNENEYFELKYLKEDSKKTDMNCANCDQKQNNLEWVIDNTKTKYSDIKINKKSYPKISTYKSKVNYLSILSPMNNSKYIIDNIIPINSQKIKLNFETDLKYEKAKWKIYKDDILHKEINWNDVWWQLEKWKRKFEIEILSENKTIKTWNSQIIIN